MNDDNHGWRRWLEIAGSAIGAAVLSIVAVLAYVTDRESLEQSKATTAELREYRSRDKDIVGVRRELDNLNARLNAMYEGRGVAVRAPDDSPLSTTTDATLTVTITIKMWTLTERKLDMSARARNAERTFDAVPIQRTGSVVAEYVREYLATDGLATDVEGRWHAALIQMGIALPTRELTHMLVRAWGKTDQNIVVAAEMATSEVTKDLAKLAQVVQQGYGAPLPPAKSTWLAGRRVIEIRNSPAELISGPFTEPALPR